MTQKTKSFWIFEKICVNYFHFDTKNRIFAVLFCLKIQKMAAIFCIFSNTRIYGKVIVTALNWSDTV